MKLIDKNNKKQAMSILEQAFKDYNLYEFMCEKNKKGYEKKFKVMMEYNLEECFLNGKVWLTEDLETGILMVKDPKKNKKSLKYLFVLAKFIFYIGIKQTQKIIKISERFLLHYPKDKNYTHFWIIAISPTKQGQGNSSKMLDFISNYAQNQDIYMETTSEKNMQIYSKKGYKLFDQMSKKDYGIDVWILKKQANPKI